MRLYKDIALRKNEIKSNKNSTQHLTKNKSLTYYHIEGKNNNLNNITDIKVNCSNNSGNQIIEYNKNYLLIAYKKGVLELFKALKSYMKKEVYKYNKIKNEFLQNIQKFYNDEKNKENKVIKKNSSLKNYCNIKSYSKNKSIKNSRKSNQIKDKFMKNISSNIPNQTQIINQANNNLGISLWPNTNNISNKNKNNNVKKRNINNNNLNFNSFMKHKSLYTLLKSNKMIGNSPLKYIDNSNSNNIIKKFIKFSNNISKIKSKENKKVNEEIILDKENNINGQRKIIGRTTKNNDLILKIKDSLDDNLKHILNFSYENFLNKESERD
jgi:hypothetical protein